MAKAHHNPKHHPNKKNIGQDQHLLSLLLLFPWEDSKAQDRILILEEVYKKGWATSVSIEPFLDSRVVKLIEKIKPYVTNTIWVGPMNKIHVPKELWGEKQADLYSPESLIEFKKAINSQNIRKIRFKDHFNGIIQKFMKKSQNHNFPYSQSSIPIPQR